MRLQPIFLVVASLTMTSCKNLTNDVFKRHTDSALINLKTFEIIDSSKSVMVPADVDTNFETFLKYFNKDSLFQISRIDFPTKVKTLDDDFEPIDEVITKENFRKLDFSITDTTNKPYDNYTKKIKITGNKAVIEIRGIENGIFLDVYFVKYRGKWKLQTWIDTST